MKIYRFIEAQELEEEVEEVPLTVQQVEDAFQRAYNIHREYLLNYDITSWQQWVRETDAYHLAITLDSERTLYDKYWSHLPEGMMPLDVVEAYKANRLSTTPLEPYRYPKREEYEPLGVTPEKSPWMWKLPGESGEKDIKGIYETAIQRILKSNREEVEQARKDLFLLYYTDLELADKLGVSKAELNKKIRSMSGTNKGARDLQNRLNAGVPVEHMWSGIYNSAYLSDVEILPEDVDQFVKEVNPIDEENYMSSGRSLRTSLVSTFMAINTSIKYDDLTIEIGDPNLSNDPNSAKNRDIRGKYFSKDKKIIIKQTYGTTLPHEVGHYLDYKFGEEFGFSGALSSTTGIYNRERLLQRFPKEKVDWGEKYLGFVKELSERSNISSEYMQSFVEVFARFVAEFVSWTKHQAAAGRRENEFNDRFTEVDFSRFVYLLQEKSYLDRKYGLGN